GIVGDDDDTRVLEHVVQRSHELAFSSSVHLLSPSCRSPPREDHLRVAPCRGLRDLPSPATLDLSNRAHGTVRPKRLKPEWAFACVPVIFSSRLCRPIPRD